MRRRALLLAALLATGAHASGQTAGTSNLLATPAGWPSTGAVTGFTGLALDPLAIYMNPAGLATQDERSLLVHHGLMPFSSTWDLAAVSYPIPGLGGVGLGFARLGTGGIDGYDAENRPTGSSSYRETAAAASVARRVRGPLWAGATFKILGQSLAGISASAPALDLGVLVRPSILRGGQIGLSAENVVAGSLDLGGVAPVLDRSFRLGLGSPEWRFHPMSSARLVLDLATGSEGMKPRVGAEFARAGLGSVRAGYAEGGPLLGLGFRFRRYEFDYAYQSGSVEATQQFALRLNWGVPVSRYEAQRLAELQKAAEDSVRARHAGELMRMRAEFEKTLSDSVARESARKLAATLGGLARAALARGDAEEASALVRGIPSEAGGDTLEALRRDVATARDRAAARALARADSLQGKGLVFDAAEQVAIALRLDPDDPQAKARWAELQSSLSSLAKSAAEVQSLNRKLQALTTLNDVARAYAEGRYQDASVAAQRALTLDPTSSEARDWRDRIDRRLTTPKPELDARIKQLYIKGMEAFTAGDYREALKNWEQILALDPLNESARRNVLEARERMKSEARR